MEKNKTILILKLSSREHIFGLDQDQILKLASRSFYITPKRVFYAKFAYLCYQKQIIGKFKIIDTVTKRTNNLRTNFILEPIKSDEIGKILNLTTPNPASTITPEKFKSKLLN